MDWIDSEIFERDDAASFLENVHGILVPGGFGERGTEGKMRAVKFARERKVPFFGICYGLHMAVIETARDLAGLEGAGTSENGNPKHPVIGLMTEWVKGNALEKRQMNGDLGGTMRLGAYDSVLTPGSRVAEVYGATDHQRASPPPLRGEHRIHALAREAGLQGLRLVSRQAPARDHGDPRPSLVHRRPVHPELKSRPLDPHPLFTSFIAAAVQQSRLV